VCGNANYAASLRDAINSYNNNEWIFVNTHDEPMSNRLTNNLHQAIKSIGGSSKIFENPNFKYRSAYILIGKPNLGENNGLEFYVGNVDSDQKAWIKVYLVSNKDGDFLAIYKIESGENYLFNKENKLPKLGLAKLFFPKQCFEKGAVWELYYGDPNEGGVMLAQDIVDRKWSLS
jgi:hypothetical protein